MDIYIWTTVCIYPYVCVFVFSVYDFLYVLTFLLFVYPLAYLLKTNILHFIITFYFLSNINDKFRSFNSDFYRLICRLFYAIRTTVLIAVSILIILYTVNIIPSSTSIINQTPPLFIINSHLLVSFQITFLILYFNSLLSFFFINYSSYSLIRGKIALLGTSTPRVCHLVEMSCLISEESLKI